MPLTNKVSSSSFTHYLDYVFLSIKKYVDTVNLDNNAEVNSEWCKRPRKLQKTNEVARSCDENERCGHTRE